MSPKRVVIAMIVTLLPLVFIGGFLLSVMVFHGCTTTAPEEREHFDNHGHRLKKG